MRAVDGKLGRGTKVGNGPWTESEDEEINVFDNLVLSWDGVVLQASAVPSNPQTDPHEYITFNSLFIK